MIARDLLERVIAQPVKTRIADVADRDPVVMPERDDQRSAHAGILRLALRRLVDRGVGARGLVMDEPLHFAAVQLLLRARCQCFSDFRRNQGNRNPARDLARVVAAHPVGEHCQSHFTVGGDAVFVVRAHHAGMGRRRDLEH
ncbi:hypothetical protein D3C83_26740 [compost metagenome]